MAAIDLFGGGGGVKSVQRGVATGENGNLNNVEIAISAVDPAKCLVTLNPSYTHYNINSSGSTCYVRTPYFVSLTANTLTVGPSARVSGATYVGLPFSWQVVEYA